MPAPYCSVTDKRHLPPPARPTLKAHVVLLHPHDKLPGLKSLKMHHLVTVVDDMGSVLIYCPVPSVLCLLFILAVYLGKKEDELTCGLCCRMHPADCIPWG